MSRTILYDILGDYAGGPIPKETRQRIIDVQCEMNRSLTWTTEQVALDLDSHCVAPYVRDFPLPLAARLGWGSTNVENDDWNAVLIVRFLRWVSTQLSPTAFVRLRDDGNYVIPCHVQFHQGHVAIDSVAIGNRRKTFTTEQELQEFNERVAAGRNGHWFQPVLSLGYLDRPEIAELCTTMGADAFGQLTLEDVADQIVFPWATEQTKAV